VTPIAPSFDKSATSGAPPRLGYVETEELERRSKAFRERFGHVDIVHEDRTDRASELLARRGAVPALPPLERAQGDAELARHRRSSELVRSTRDATSSSL